MSPPDAIMRPAAFRWDSAFDRLQIDRLGLAALVLFKVVAHALVLLQRAHSGTLDRGDVNEGVIATLIRADEAVALGIVKKFDSAKRHCAVLPYWGEPPIGPPALGEAKERKEEPQSALKSVRLRLVAILHIVRMARQCKCGSVWTRRRTPPRAPLAVNIKE
jgi:hypothetical protein